jgi:hypothetical protein
VTTRHGCIVLCVGADPINLNLRCGLLREHGCHVRSAGRAPEGVIRFGQEAVDAVVLDLNSDGVSSGRGRIEAALPEGAGHRAGVRGEESGARCDGLRLTCGREARTDCSLSDWGLHERNRNSGSLTNPGNRLRNETELVAPAMSARR